jgi:hypothetical protein
MSEVLAQAIDAAPLDDLVAFVSGRTAFLLRRAQLATLPSSPMDGEFAGALAAPTNGRLLVLATSPHRSIVGFVSRSSLLEVIFSLPELMTCRACSAAA